MSQRSVVAVIDDDLTVLDATQTLLAAYGYDAELYASAEEFLSHASTTKARCLIIDVNLGGSCGIEMANQLRSAGLSFPIIFITGLNSPQVQRKALEAGCIGVLEKPCSGDELIEALSALTK